MRPCLACDRGERTSADTTRHLSRAKPTRRGDDLQLTPIAKHAIQCSDFARELYRCVTGNDYGHVSKPINYSEELYALHATETILQRSIAAITKNIQESENLVCYLGYGTCISRFAKIPSLQHTSEDVKVCLLGMRQRWDEIAVLEQNLAETKEKYAKLKSWMYHLIARYAITLRQKDEAEMNLSVVHETWSDVFEREKRKRLDATVTRNIDLQNQLSLGDATVKRLKTENTQLQQRMEELQKQKTELDERLKLSQEDRQEKDELHRRYIYLCI